MTGAGKRGLRGITAAEGLQVLQGLAFIAVIGMVFFGTKPLNAILLIFLFCFLASLSSAKEHISENIFFLVLCMQYPLIHLFKVNFTDDPIPGALYYSVAKSRMWVWGGLIALLSVVFFCRLKNLSRNVDIAIPPILFVTFALFAFFYWQSGAYSDWQGGGCRIKGLHKSVFDAPLIFTTLTVVYLRNIDVKSLGARRVAYALVACSMVMSLTFAGARSVAVAQLVTYIACCLILAFSVASGRRVAQQVFGSAVLGIIVGLALVSYVNCGANSVARILEPSADVSIAKRRDFYMTSLALIAEKPIMGHGIAFESLVADRPHKHVHNIYLSWGLWGGVISLVSGILFMLASFWANLREMRHASALILALSLVGPWGVSQLFDSFFVWPYLFYLFIVYLCLGQVLLVREAQSRRRLGTFRGPS